MATAPSNDVGEKGAQVDPPLFVGGDRAPPPARAPGIPAAYQQLVSTVFNVEPWADFQQLVKQLGLDENELHDQVVREHLGRAESKALQADKLYRNADLAFESWRDDARVVGAAMWSAATAKLQDEKAAGRRSKAITDADVEFKVAELFPDEWRDYQGKLRAFEGAVKHLKFLAERWATRPYSLATLAGKRY